jgi:hypothetical protein
MPFVEDLSEFLSEPEFATNCELRFAAGGTRRFVAIFDEASLDADLGEYRHETSSPRLNGRAADFAGAKRGDVLALNPATDAERTLDVMGAPMIDGTGWAVLRLAPQHEKGGR